MRVADVNVKAQDRIGRTPLDFAAGYKYIPCGDKSGKNIAPGLKQRGGKLKAKQELERQ